MAKYTEIPDSTPAQNTGSSIGRIAKGAAFGLSDILGAIQHLPQTLLLPLIGTIYEKASGKKFPTEEIKKVDIGLAHGADFSKLPEMLGVSRESYAPQNLVEKTLQNTLAQAPLALVGGTPLAQALAQTGLGNAVRSGLEYAEAPEIIQDIGQFATELGYSGYKTGLLKKGTYGAEKRKLFEKAAEAAKPVTTSIQLAEEPIAKLSEKIRLTANEKISKPLERVLETIEKNVNGGKVNLNDLWEMEKDFKALSYDKSLNKVARHYITEVVNGFNKIIDSTIKDHPDFLANLSPARQMHAVENMNLMTKNAIEYLTAEFSKKVPGIKFVEDVVGKILSTPEKIAKAMTYPAVRKYYSKMILATTKDNLPNMIKYAKLIDNSIKDQENKLVKSKYKEII